MFQDSTAKLLSRRYEPTKLVRAHFQNSCWHHGALELSATMSTLARVHVPTTERTVRNMSKAIPQPIWNSGRSWPPYRTSSDLGAISLAAWKDLAGSGVNLCSRQLCCKSQMALSLANSRASRLCVHPFDPLSAPGGSHEWIRKILCFPRNLSAPELHDAHGVRRLAVIGQDEFGDPKITAANDPPDS